MKQKYLLTPGLEIKKSYSIMSPFIDKAKKLIKPFPSNRDWKFAPSGMGRTRISQKLKAGVNPIEFYNRGQSTANQALKRELLIREFWAQSKTEWEPRRKPSSWLEPGAKSDKLFEQWKAGRTGYLLIDAGMSQLKDEGWLPNRARMLCASFLTKNYGVWWTKGEQYFAKKLIDYNLASNIGNWQWVSGAGFNARLTDVLSPDIQLIKFDPKLDYCRSILGKAVVPIGLTAREHIKTRPIIELTYEASKAEYLKLL